MKMTTDEIRQYFENNKPEQILLHSADQCWETVENPMKLRLAFSSIRVTCNPNRIYLRQGDSSICLQQVKYINIDTEKIPIGVVLDVVCGSMTHKQNDTHITLTVIT